MQRRMAAWLAIVAAAISAQANAQSWSEARTITPSTESVDFVTGSDPCAVQGKVPSTRTTMTARAISADGDRMVGTAAETPACVDPPAAATEESQPDSTSVAAAVPVRLTLGRAGSAVPKSSTPNPRSLPEHNPATRACVEKAATAFELEPLWLYLILDVEAGTLGQVSGNKNGSWDIGPMQINSWWLPTFQAHGIGESQLLNDLCTNIFAGAWILRRERDKASGVADAIARYHSPGRQYQKRYLGLVQAAIDRRIRQPPYIPDSAPATTTGSVPAQILEAAN